MTLAHIGTGNDIVLSLTSFPPPTTVTVFQPVQNLNDLILFTQDGALRSLKARANPPTLNNLSALTGPEGWQSAGSHASHAYGYLNSAAATSGLGTWRMLAISRGSQSVTTTTSGLVYGADQPQYDVLTNSLLPSGFLITTPRAGTAFSGSSLTRTTPQVR